MILISLFTLILGIVIANLSSNLIKRLIRRTNSHKIIKKTFKTSFSVDNILADLTKLIIYLITLNLILQQQGLDFTKSIINFSIIILVLVVLSFKDLFPSLIAGIYIKLFRKIRLNQTIKTNGIKGKVMKITFAETTLFTEKKEHISIPNINLIKLR